MEKIKLTSNNIVLVEMLSGEFKNRKIHDSSVNVKTIIDQLLNSNEKEDIANIWVLTTDNKLWYKNVYGEVKPSFLQLYTNLFVSDDSGDNILDKCIWNNVCMEIYNKIDEKYELMSSPFGLNHYIDETNGALQIELSFIENYFKTERDYFDDKENLEEIVKYFDEEIIPMFVDNCLFDSDIEDDNQCSFTIYEFANNYIETITI